HVLLKLGIKEESDDGIRKLRERIKTALDASADGRLHIQEAAAALLTEEETFLLMFHRETPLNNSVEFMRIWRNYDTNGSGYISAKELKVALASVICSSSTGSGSPLRKAFTFTRYACRLITLLFPLQMEMFDKNRDGRLELNHLARILALKENFLLKFRTDASSQEDRRRDFEKIFTHYDVSQTGALEGPEVDGFVKDMMELVKPSLSGGGDLERFRKTLLAHCDINKDGKIQKNELALCLGLKLC
uniref:Secretagogin, EF-hand calcium binding protein n=1 Tax=Gouania willdenowi TaxID=441366 RepID=A0A8C5GZ13_GOUWI